MTMNRFILPLSRLACVVVLVSGFGLFAQEPRLSSLSTRAKVGTDANQLITGFALGPGPSRTVLIRAAGPTLALPPFNLAGSLGDPVLTLYNSSNVELARNDNWGTPIGDATLATAATFSAVGAFPFIAAGSRDAALVVNLPPGAYSATVGGLDKSTGIAIIEVYEIGATPGSTRLTSLSSRAMVGSGAAVTIPGINISAGVGTRRLLIRAAGPALIPFGLTEALADPVIAVTNPGDSITFASNNDWGTPMGPNPASAATIASAIANYTGYPFAAGSRDSAVLVELAPGAYTVQVSGAGNAAGVALVEVYDLTPAVLPVVSVAASKATGDESGTNPGEFTFTRTGDTMTPLTAAYTIGGSATNGVDYASLSGSVTFPVGVGSVRLALAPIADTPNETDETVILTVAAGSLYTAAPDSASVTITDTSPRPIVSIATSRATSDETGLNPGEFTFTRVGDFSVPLSVLYSVSGSATNGVDYAQLPGLITFPAGASTVRLPLAPNSDASIEGSESVVINLTAAPHYSVIPTGAAVTIADGPSTVVPVSTTPTPTTPNPASPAPSVRPTVSVVASKATSDESGTNLGEFTFTRTGDTAAPLTASYSVGGTAINGFDYPFLSGSLTFPAGAATVRLPLSPNPDVQTEGATTVTIAVAAGEAYTAAPTSATVTITDSPSTLYVATIRPVPIAASTSAASGTATILLSSSGTIAAINVASANLSSAITNAYIVLGPNEEFAFSLGTAAQVNGVQWTFAPTGLHTSAALLTALRTGNLAVRFDTAQFPTGEAKGAFIVNAASQTVTAPIAPVAPAPSAPVVVLNAQDAARLLTQATFGPKKSEIDALAGRSAESWIATQMALPASFHFAEASADFAINNGGGAGSPGTGQPNTRFGGVHRQHAWWKIALNSPDQLRQRVAFALSQIFVTSDANGTISNWQNGHVTYYDLLVRGAFGNFRQLLEEVTLSPNMGIYLSSLRNAKATFNAQGVQLTQADENYAREIMQLFTIGRNELQADGTLKLDARGQPIPTYTQDTIVQMAKVFTGWGFFQSNSSTNFRGTGPGSESYLNPMVLYPAFHDDTAKTIVTGKVLPANQGGVKDLKDTLDTLFNHSNTPPFITRQLIQRLVTSNPSPAYVLRVASVFVNNGAGVRGDLGAVVRAILLDSEARSSASLNSASFGKPKEPLLRATALLRAFNGASDGGRYINGAFTNPEGGGTSSLAQAALRAPTVFNFFEPDYVHPGPLAAAGLFAPEFQLFTDTTAITIPNYLYNLLYANRSANTVGLTLTDLLPIAKTSQQLVDYANLVLAGGAMTKADTDLLVAALNRMPASTSDLDRVRSVLYLVVSAPEASIQK